MARPKGQLRLGAFFNPTGHHVASWRHPGAQADAGINFKHYVEIAQTAERASSGQLSEPLWIPDSSGRVDESEIGGIQ